jgi:CRP-like cAMP-binding protein
VSEDLGAFPLLQELPEAEQETLERYLEERSIEPDTRLFVPGDESDSLHLVVEGRIRLERGGKRVGSLGKGEVLGGLGLAIIGIRECSAVVEEPSRILLLDRAAYHRLRVDAPEIALSLQEALVRDFAAAVRETLDELAEMVGPHAEDEVDEGDITH